MKKVLLLIFVLLGLFGMVFAEVDISGDNPVGMGSIASQGTDCSIIDVFWGDDYGNVVDEIILNEEVYLLVSGSSSCSGINFNLIIYDNSDNEVYTRSSLVFDDDGIGGIPYSELMETGSYYFKIVLDNDITSDSGELIVVNTQADCEIISGHWEDLNGNVLDGEYFDSESQLKIHLEASNCVGSSLNIAIYEEDFLVNTDVDELVVTSVSSDDVTIDWITPEYEVEGLIAGNPEYIFEVSNNEGDILFESAQLILIDNDNSCAIYDTKDSCILHAGCEPTYYAWIALGVLFKECVEDDSVVKMYDDCSIDRITIQHGDSVPLYNSEIDDDCISVLRTCNDSVLEGDSDYVYSSCAIMSSFLNCNTDSDGDGQISSSCANYPMMNVVYEGDLDPDDNNVNVVDDKCWLKNNKSSCESNFIIDGCGSGTVLDIGTGLCWQRDMSSYLDYDGTTLNWNEAKNYCDSLSLGGHSDWRLPTRQEFYTIFDFTRYDPLVVGGNNNKFINVINYYYWTITSMGDGTLAYFITLSTATGYQNIKTDPEHVCCIR